jgi:hypothetical protein
MMSFSTYDTKAGRSHNEELRKNAKDLRQLGSLSLMACNLQVEFSLAALGSRVWGKFVARWQSRLRLLRSLRLLYLAGLPRLQFAGNLAIIIVPPGTVFLRADPVFYASVSRISSGCLRWAILLSLLCHFSRLCRGASGVAAGGHVFVRRGVKAL